MAAPSRSHRLSDMHVVYARECYFSAFDKHGMNVSHLGATVKKGLQMKHVFFHLNEAHRNCTEPCSFHPMRMVRI